MGSQLKQGWSTISLLEAWAQQIMENLQTSLHVAHEAEFKSTPEWQLIGRILRTEPFQKSSRLPNLLCYLAEHSIRGRLEELTEQKIGTAVFAKPEGYSPSEDSAVRVQVRQLRLRLHEYFDCVGRDETLVVEIPKGSYELVFHSALPKPALPPPVPGPVPGPQKKSRKIGIRYSFFWAALIAAIISSLGWYRAVRTSPTNPVPWPVSTLIQNNTQTKIVVSDGSTMLRLLAQKEFSLQQYLQPGFLESMTPSKMDGNVAQLVKYISDSQLTSYADLVVASTLWKLAGPSSDHLVLSPARDLNRWDLAQGDYVFVGSPTSNPWVSLFADKLNFKVVEDGVGGKMYFLNKKPLPGEQQTYEGLPYTGSGGDDYATISLLPSGSGDGNELILQGLREEGTEALAELLADPAHRAKLKRALHIVGDPKRPVYFEALIRAQTVAGAPVSISIVATRIITP